MSPELKAFYQAILTWIEMGMPYLTPFDRHCGLCGNLVHYMNSQNMGSKDFNAVLEEQQGQFRQANLCKIFPFNTDNEDYRNDRHTMYENPKRLAWIKEHAA